MKEIKTKNRINRLAPTYIVLTVLLFAGFLWTNRDNLRYQGALSITPWIKLAIIAAIVPIAADFLSEKTKQAQKDSHLAEQLKLFRIVCGIGFLTLVGLFAMGLDFFHALQTFFMTHGQKSIVYGANGAYSLVDILGFSLVGLTAFLGIYSLILKSTIILSKRGAQKAFIALLLTIPVTAFALVLNMFNAW